MRRPMMTEVRTSLVRRLFNVAAVLIGSTLFVLPLCAQTGNVSGVVTDSSKRVLVGAQVKVDGRPITTTSDESGKYTLLGVPAGNVKINATYLGFESSTQELAVAAGATETLDFALGLPGITTELTVNAAAEAVGQQQALNDQKSSINLVNIVSADQISSFPDPNSVEACLLIPVIVLQSD